MRRSVRLSVAAPTVLLAAVASPVWAQEEAQELPEPLEVGAMAPDFELPAANRDGVLDAPIHLSDFRGQTVVLAFFFKARTPG